ncbi:MAG: sigma 54-interacting transcriptional regulator [Myxococcaceae bacterium]|nr:sigma 54-interacting transcriptional regulator [Myxococcaceae bacterium]
MNLLQNSSGCDAAQPINGRLPVNSDRLSAIDMGDFGSGRQVTRELRVPELADALRVRAVRVERVGQPPLVLRVYADSEFVLGRSAEASVVMPDDAVSRQHGRLWCDSSGQLVYRDLRSRNGTLRLPGGRRLDEHEVKDTVPLKAGDVLWLGTERARVVMLAEAPEADARVSAAQSPASRRLEQALDVAARHQLPVVLMGESGTGKTHSARRIHDRSGRSGPFVSVNCGRLPRDAQALQSELLGHVRGSFTGAVQDRQGKFFLADQGTLFLDEVESLPREAQDFLLDVLEGSGSFSPLGGTVDRAPAPRFRLVSASKTPLRQSALRPDLVQRLLGDVIVVPSLGERREDVPLLVNEFLARLSETHNQDAEVTAEAMALLQSRAWPGQVRELRRVVETTVAKLAAERLARGLDTQRLVVGVDALVAQLENEAVALGDAAAPTTSQPALVRPERRVRPADLSRADCEAAVAAHGGNKTHAAKALGIALNTLKAKLR